VFVLSKLFVTFSDMVPKNGNLANLTFYGFKVLLASYDLFGEIKHLGIVLVVLKSLFKVFDLSVNFSDSFG
jgi:hypothetical protein